MSSIPYTQQKSSNVIEKLLISVFIACLISLGLLFSFGVGIQIFYANQIFPGVSIAGVDIGGLSPQEASLKLQKEIVYPEQGRVLLRDGEKTYLLTPVQLGLFFDPETTTTQAMKIGREGSFSQRIKGQWNSWRFGRKLSPVFVFDKREAVAQLNRLASQINVPVVEADLSVNGVEVIMHSGQIGRHINVDATVEKIAALVPTLTDGIIDLVIEETPPHIIDAQEQAEFAKKILSNPLKLTAENASSSPWEFAPDVLATMLRIERIQDDQGSRFQIGLSTDFLQNFLVRLSRELSISPEDARYIFNDDSHELEVIENATIGRELNIDATIQEIQKKITEEGNHEVALIFDEIKPTLTDD